MVRGWANSGRRGTILSLGCGEEREEWGSAKYRSIELVKQERLQKGKSVLISKKNML